MLNLAGHVCHQKTVLAGKTKVTSKASGVHREAAPSLLPDEAGVG